MILKIKINTALKRKHVYIFNNIDQQYHLTRISYYWYDSFAKRVTSSIRSYDYGF